jgi:hypothetical protein
MKARAMDLRYDRRKGNVARANGEDGVALVLALLFIVLLTAIIPIAAGESVSFVMRGVTCYANP